MNKRTKTKKQAMVGTMLNNKS